MQTRRQILRLKRITWILTAALVLSIGSTVFIKLTDNQKIRELQAASASQENAAGAIQSADINYDPNAVVAEFNGGKLLLGDVWDEWSVIVSQYESLGIDKSDIPEEGKIEFLNSMIEPMVMKSKAVEFGVYELSDEKKAEIESEVQSEFDTMVDYYTGYRFDESMTEDELKQEAIAYLADNGYTYEILLDEAMQNVWQENLKTYALDGFTVTDEDVLNYYNSRVESDQIRYAADHSQYETDRENGVTIVWNPAGVRTVQAILIAFDSDQISRYLQLQSEMEAGNPEKLSDVEALYGELEPKANEALERAKAGEDFTALMIEYSDDSNLSSEPARSTGYYVSANSTGYNESFVEAAMALQKVGDISDLVYVDGGIYILRYASDVDEGAVSYESVKDSLAIECEQELKAVKYNDTINEWIKESAIVYHTELL